MINLLAQSIIKPKYQKKVNILVTGGAGFIGSNLVEARTILHPKSLTH